MSRIGKQIITIPEKTDVKIENGAVIVSGPLGSLQEKIHPKINVEIKDSTITLSPKKNDDIESSALWGTSTSLVSNMVQGVNSPYEKKLVVEGVGYRAEVSGNELVLSIGFSHSVNIKIPEDLKVSVEKNVITISGISKQRVGQFAAMVRAKKKPEPYKGKGIRYEDEVVRRKEGKKSA